MKKNRFEKIRSMTLDEFADFLDAVIIGNCENCMLGDSCNLQDFCSCRVEIKKWLMEESVSDTDI
jgi:hypothetical protein